jgi:hypothetical protein
MHDKSRPTHEDKKQGKSAKQKRAEKRAAHAPGPMSVVPPRKPRSTS